MKYDADGEVYALALMGLVWKQSIHVLYNDSEAGDKPKKLLPAHRSRVILDECIGAKLAPPTADTPQGTLVLSSRTA